jgi:hypothetical protein
MNTNTPPETQEEAFKQLEAYYGLVIKSAAALLNHAIAGQAALSTSKALPKEKRYEFSGVELEDIGEILKDMKGLNKAGKEWAKIAWKESQKLRK